MRSRLEQTSHRSAVCLIAPRHALLAQPLQSTSRDGHVPLANQWKGTQ